MVKNAQAAERVRKSAWHLAKLPRVSEQHVHDAYGRPDLALESRGRLASCHSPQSDLSGGLHQSFQSSVQAPTIEHTIFLHV